MKQRAKIMRQALTIGAVVSTMNCAMAQTGKMAQSDIPAVPGAVISYMPAQSRLYIGSPGLAVLPDGKYLAKCDWFGPNSGQNRSGLTRVFVSGNKGQSWQWLSDVPDLFWASIFTHKGALYLLGTTKEYGDLVIRRSVDSGRHWTTAKDENSGLLRAGKYHCAPTPVIEHNGRLRRGFEDAMGTGGWGQMFRAFMLSVPVDADLMKAASWTTSTPLERDAAWNNNDFNGWLEGNAVVTPEGNIVDVLRVDTKSPDEKAAVVAISADGKTGTFDPATGFVPLPGAAKKFTIRFDPQSKLYWSLANYIPPRYRKPGPGSIRNTLALISSPDLRNWTVKTAVLYHPDPVKHGFQYVDWLFEGEDIIFASRTAYDDNWGGADNYHNANYLTFHRLPNFRHLTMADSVPMLELPATR
jgi:hypothetical protein